MIYSFYVLNSILHIYISYAICSSFFVWSSLSLYSNGKNTLFFFPFHIYVQQKLCNSYITRPISSLLLCRMRILALMLLKLYLIPKRT